MSAGTPNGGGQESEVGALRSELACLRENLYNEIKVIKSRITRIEESSKQIPNYDELNFDLSNA